MLQSTTSTVEEITLKTYTLEPRIRQQIDEIGNYRSFVPQLNRIPFEECPETYVMFARQANKSGDTPAVEAIMDIVTARVASAVAKRACLSRLPCSAREDIVNDIVHDICVMILTDDRRGEFFNIRFWRAVHCHVINHYVHWQSTSKSTIAIDRRPAEKGGEWVSFIDTQAACKTPDPETYAQLHDALSTLQPRERAVFLANRYLGLTQCEIAIRLNVSTRTVTAIITSAKRKLAIWRDES